MKRTALSICLLLATPARAGVLQATYLGGSDHDSDASMAFHPTTGELYVTGATRSSDLLATGGAAQPGFGGGAQDAFVSRLSADLTTLFRTSYLGGNSGDAGNVIVGESIAFHPTDGTVYVTGHTYSADFPGTAGGAQAALAGDSDAFVARFDAQLGTLLQATYLGGSEHDLGLAIAVHPSGHVYVLGNTGYTGAFPGVGGGAQPLFGGGVANDAFISRLSADLTVLEQSTYLGGSEAEDGHDITVHSNGDVCVVGNTYSDDFPVTGGSAQGTHGGIRDAFVSCLSADLTLLRHSSFLGGSGVEYASSVAVDATSGDLYVAGQTYSLDLPGAAGGAQPAKAETDTSYDAFVAQLDATLATLRQSTYLGSTDDEYNVVVAVHPGSGEVYLAGETYKSDFPGTAGGADEVFSWRPDAFAARLSPDLTTLHQATYYGGDDADSCGDVAIHPTTGEVYLAGTTITLALQGVAGGAQELPTGLQDVFLVRLDPSLAAEVSEPDIHVVPASHDFGDAEPGTTSSAVEVSIANEGQALLQVASVALSDATQFALDLAGGASPCGVADPDLGPGASCTVTVAFAPADEGDHTADLSVTSNDPDEPTVSVALAGTGAAAGTGGGPDVSVTPVAHDFGARIAGTTSPPLAVAIANDGDEPLSVADIALTEAVGFELDLAGCGGAAPVLAAGDGCTVEVVFAPEEAIAYAADLRISSDDPDEAVVAVLLEGTGREEGEPGPDEGDEGCGCASGAGGGWLGLWGALLLLRRADS